MSPAGFVRLALFALAFSAEVKVKASTTEPKVAAREPLMQPQSCWKNAEAVCAVRTGSGEKSRLAWDEGEIALDEKTALVRHVSRMFVTAASITVPYFTIVLRKGYGLGAQAMAIP